MSRPARTRTRSQSRSILLPVASRLRPCRGQSGVALVLVVWILAILSIIAGEFIFSSRLRILVERNRRDQDQSYALAVAGYHAALEHLKTDFVSVSRGEDGELLLHAEGGDEGEPAERGDEGEPAERSDEPLGEGTFAFRIQDEDGKIDINSQRRNTLIALLKEAGHPVGQERDILADSILDWIDPDRNHRLNGAEEDYYRSLEQPYSCKDGPFDTAEELLLVRGMREEYFFGKEDDERTFLPLRDFITPYPVSFNPDTATAEVLRVLRLTRPRASSRLSQYYSIVATGKAQGTGPERSVRAVVRRESRAGKITFRLLYWNDNFFPERLADGVD